MDLVVEHQLDASCDRVFLIVADLGRYPDWMGIVHSAESSDDETWNVQLRARVGPFARSKRLTMTRVAYEPSSFVRFERHEADGRSHGVWTLEASVRPVGATTDLTMTLHYGGRLWSSVVERVLFDEIEASKKRLAALATD